MTYHGYVDLFLNDRWVSVNPAFSRKMCEKYEIIPVEFNGSDDALFHHIDSKGRLHIDYIKDLGTHDDLPFDEIVTAFRNMYDYLMH